MQFVKFFASPGIKLLLILRAKRTYRRYFTAPAWISASIGGKPGVPARIPTRSLAKQENINTVIKALLDLFGSAISFS
jgi:hypothetical protein